MLNSKTDSFPFWTITITALAIGILMYSLWLFKVNPFYNLWNPLYSRLTALGASIAKSLNISGLLSSFMQKLTSDPLTALATIGSVVGGAITVISYISKIRADNLRKATEEAATQTVNDMDNQLQNTAAQLQSATIENEALKRQISDLTSTDYLTQLVGKDTEITKLRNQMELLNEQLKQKDEEIAAGAKVMERIVVK